MTKDFVVRTKEEYRDAKSYKYVNFSDDTTGTTQALWTPASGKAVRVVQIIISVDNACKMELKFGTTTFCHLEFESRKALPLELTFDVKGGTGEALNAYLLSDTGTTNCYVTVIGEEE